MSDEAPKWLKIDIGQMQKEYDRLLEGMREIEDVADRFHLPLHRRVPTAGSPAGGRSLSGMTLRDAVHVILSEQGRTMHISELHQMLTDAGVEIRGKNEKNTLFATIRGDKRFVNLGRNTWDLVERQKSKAQKGGEARQA